MKVKYLEIMNKNVAFKPVINEQYEHVEKSYQHFRERKKIRLSFTLA
jgi:hypothetical protein